mmetsp:Transcript_67871/g.151592  ORF Transcript_67871/g.151592 Transcript_67871/m.151592 type:complete len:89 (+) Transcript_67871:419-685(+)
MCSPGNGLPRESNAEPLELRRSGAALDRSFGTTPITAARTLALHGSHICFWCRPQLVTAVGWFWCVICVALVAVVLMIAWLLHSCHAV